jgi:phage terminase large subunit-like protein
MAKTPLDPVTQYATDVSKGRTVAGRLVRLACARHLNDLKQQKAKALDWRPAEAQNAIDFYAEVLCLPEETAAGETVADEVPVDGSPFVLQPWQAFIVGSCMGWYTSAGYRRFRDAYIEIAKGSGKTPLGAGLMLYMLVADGERGAQIFFAAVTRDQARLAFADAEKMVQASPALRDLIDQKVNNLAVLSTGSFLRAISSEKRGLDGKRVHGALIDEEHEHLTPIVVGKVRRGTKGRRNALVMRTTNSGFDRGSICWHDHEYSRKVLEGGLADESWFAFVCGLDPCTKCRGDGKEFVSDDCPDCDDWRTEGPHWLKACPNLGVSVSWQYYRELVKQAKGRPDAVSDLLRFNFCVWTQGVHRAISLSHWHGCQPFPPEADLIGVPCFGGLDLGQSDDFSAWARIWVLADGRVAVKMRFWVPESALVKFPDRPYDEWQRVGVLTVTEGDTVDYGEISDTIAADCAADGVREIGYDNRFAEQMAQNLTGQGIVMANTGQGFQLNMAVKRMLELIVDGQLCHGGNPILSWMASNFVVRHGRMQEIRPDKEKTPDKIDGIVALDMAIDRGIIRQEATSQSVYLTRGVRQLGQTVDA